MDAFAQFLFVIPSNARNLLFCRSGALAATSANFNHRSARGRASHDPRSTNHEPRRRSGALAATSAKQIPRALALGMTCGKQIPHFAPKEVPLGDVRNDNGVERD